MSEEIIIFDIPEDEIIPNKSQRQLEFENLEKNSKLPKHHFKSFYEMEELTTKKMRPTSSVTSVILQWVLRFCMPIIITSDDKFSISVQLDYPIIAIVDDVRTSIPSNTQFKVIGIMIPSIFVSAYNKYMLVHYDHVEDDQLASTGHYGLFDFQTERYTQQRDSFTHPGILNELGNRVIFTDNEHAIIVLNKIMKYVEFIENYYNVNFPNLRLDMSNMNKSNSYISVLPWKILHGRRIIQGEDVRPSMKVSHTIHGQLYNLSDKLLELLNKVQNSNFGNAFYYDVAYMMDRNNLTHLYNIGEKLGTDDNTFKGLYDKKLKEIEYAEAFQKQVNEADNQKLDFMRRQAIAFEKYKTTDLTSLDKKQLAVIELEFKRKQAVASSNDKEIGKLFRNLRRSFDDVEDIELKNNLKAIEKLIDKKDLDDIKLISGMCPHVYWQGKIIHDNFKKVDMSSILREEIIHRFSGHNDDTGFYCKICGELIADPDNKSSVTFSGDRSYIPDEDPLQSMIWKEAMYIVMSNIKINPDHPIPIKPLVNSLAYGLRNIIATEEAKLYRSKTNTSESIKDTTNLYASIYIYAALCAMMLANPGKLSFGRDKPEESEKKLESATSSIEHAKEKHVAKAHKDDAINKIDRKNKKNKNVKDVSNTTDIDEVDKVDEADDADNADEESDAIPVGDIDRSDNSDGDSEMLEPIQSTSANANAVAVAVAAGEHSRRLSNGKRSKERNGYKRYKGRSRRKRVYRYIGGGMKTTDPKLAEKYFLNTAFKLIIISKASIISRLKSISIDLIKQILTRNAFPWAMKYVKPIDTNTTETKSMYNDPVQADPFYNYVHFAMQANNKHKISFDDSKQLLGRDLGRVLIDIKHGISPYEHVKEIPPWHLSNDALLDEYMYGSYVSMKEYIKEKIYEKSFVPRHVQVSEYLEKYSNLLDIEKKLRKRTIRYLLRPNIEIKLLNDFLFKYNNFNPKLLDLAQHYCPNGELHEVGSYLYIPVKKATDAKPVVAIESDSSKIVEINKKDIVGWLDNKDTAQLSKFATLKLINERCSKCKNTIRDAKSSVKSDKSLALMFKKIDDILAFYQYYESRCPKGNLHDIENEKCKKCGMITEFSKKSNVEFYEKYSDQFQKIQKEKILITIKSLKDATNANKNSIKREETKAPQYSLKKTAEWSQLSGVKYNIIVNLGFTEGHKFSDINDASINPSKSVSDMQEYNMRAMKLKGYILWVLRDYNMLLNHENIVELPPELKEIFNAQKKITIEGLSKVMPRFDDFGSQDMLNATLPIEQYSNWLQEYLAGVIVDIVSHSGEKFKILGTGLMKYFTDGILNQEKLLSKPTPYFMKNKDMVEIEDASGTDTGVSADEWANKQSSSESESDVEKEEIEEVDDFAIEENMDLEDVADTFEVE